jgi:hypothetical protein
MTNSENSFTALDWLKWVLLTAVGIFLGDVLLVLVLDVLQGFTYVGVWLAGALLGSSIGFLQWVVLRKHYGNALWWVLTSAAGWGFGYLTKEILCIYMPIFIAWIIAGIIIGAVQIQGSRRSFYTFRLGLIWSIATGLSVAAGYYGMKVMYVQNDLPTLVKYLSAMAEYLLIGMTTGLVILNSVQKTFD